MQVTYKAAEGFFLLVPVLLSYAFKGKLNELLTQYVLYFRIGFLLSVLVDLLISYRIKQRIELHNIKTKVKFTTDDYITIPKPARTAETQNTTEEAEEREVEMTVHDYDLGVINSHISKVLSNSAIHLAIHLFMKSAQPLLMLILNPVKNFVFFPPYIEYITGRTMLRPFSRNFIIGGNEKRRTSKPENVAAPVENKEDIKKED